MLSEMLLTVTSDLSQKVSDLITFRNVTQPGQSRLNASGRVAGVVGKARRQSEWICQSAGRQQGESPLIELWFSLATYSRRVRAGPTGQIIHDVYPTYASLVLLWGSCSDTSGCALR